MHKSLQAISPKTTHQPNPNFLQSGVVIAGFWLLDIAANTIGPPLLALLADLSHPDQRITANSIYCLWGALGSVLGYSAGSYGHWHQLFPFLLTKACCAPCANLKAAFLMAIILLAVCSVITLAVGKESPLARIPKDEELVEYEASRDQISHLKIMLRC